jgi:tetratricopeptide (TPR) repeat protein
MLGHELLKVIGTHALKQDLILRIGNTYVDLGDFEAASECYNQILQDRTSHVGDEAWANLQICRVRLGEVDGAIASAQRRLFAWRIRWAMFRLVRGFIPSIRPKFVRATEDIALMRGNIGGWYCSKGDLKRGLRFQRSEIRMYARIPHRAWIREIVWKAHLTIGYWYMKSGQFESASEVLTSILQSSQHQNVFSSDNPNRVRARLLLIVTLLCLSKSVEAQAELDSIEENSQSYELGFGPNQWLFELVCEHIDHPKEIVEFI